MPGICGYLNSGKQSATVDYSGILDRMAGRLQGAGIVGTSETKPIGAGVASLGASSSVGTDPNLLCAMDGDPAWLDPELQSYSTEFGNAATLARAYMKSGPSLANNLSGAYAAALIDLQARKVFLAVDRMGIRPLCYAISSAGDVIFGTTATAVVEHPGMANRLANESIFRYFYFHVVPSPSTIFSGVFKLEPAELVTVHEGHIHKHFHWTPNPSAIKDRTSSDEILDELRIRTRKAVSRYAAKESVGCFLSGGIDSSTVCGLANEVVTDPIHAYTIGFDQAGYDESSYANLAAKHFGLRHSLYYVTASDVVNAFDKITSSFDEPFGNASAVPAYFCALKAKDDGISTLLAGDGGDELFAGNERYAVQKLFEVYSRLPQFIRRFLIEPAVEYLPTGWSTLTRKAHRYVEQARIDMPERLQTYNFFEMYTPDCAFEKDFVDCIELTLPRQEMRTWYKRSHEFGFLDRMLLFDWKLTLADNDLRKVNRMCEVAGVNVEYPLLDDSLVEFSLNIPAQLKMKRRNLRFAFKSAFQDYLPKQIIEKQKHGFGLPIGEWLITSYELRENVLPNVDRFRDRGILRDEFIDEMLNKHRVEHSGFYGNLIWLIVVLEAWLSKNVD